ncbi:MAG: hypothetical protein RJA44_1442 [Pseudomonadota bacterium]
MITDPWFYAAAVPAALLVGVSKSGFASGIGALATPLLAMSVTVPQAAALVLPLLCIADLMGLVTLRRHADWSVLRHLLPAGLAGIVLGWLGFGFLSPQLVGGLTGVVTLLFLAWNLRFPPQPDATPPGPLATGALALTSGFTSFIAHSGGPPIVMALLPRHLTPLVYAGTSAVFFASINAAKWLPYGLLGLLDLSNLLTSALLMPVAALGVLLGIWATKHVSPVWFYRLVRWGMFLTGVKLIWDALR